MFLKRTNSMNATANIYVSIGQAVRQGSDESQGYRREKHSYLISVEPHHFHIPGTSYKENPLTHFEVHKDSETGDWALVKYSSKDAPTIVGNALIAETAHTSVDEIRKILAENLTLSAPSLDSYSGDEDEHWLKVFIHALQEKAVIGKFKIDEFVTWMHSYQAQRLEHEAPALIAYPRAHRDHEQKTSKHKFWITYPMAGKTRRRSNGEAATYGGLA